MMTSLQKTCCDRRKILFVGHAAVLGGAEITLLDLAKAYRNTSQVLLFSQGPFQQKLEESGVTVQVKLAPPNLLKIRTSSGIKDALTAIPSLFWMAWQVAEAAKGFEVIHANSQKAFMAAAIATKFFRCPPVVWYLHDLLGAPRFSSFNRQIAIKLANHQAARVLVNSQATGEDFMRLDGNYQLIRLLYPGISAEVFTSIPTETASKYREQLGIGHAPLIGLFSRISFIKGHHILLEAARKLPEIHLLFVGDVLFGEDDYLSRIQHIAISPELASRVHWLGFRHDIAELMASCNILVDPSTESNSFGRVIVEGQLSKVPMIATIGGAASELIEDGVTGRLVPAGDPDALATVIAELLANPELARTMAQAGYAYAQAKFSPQEHLSRYDTIIQELCQSRSRQSVLQV